MTCQKFCWNLDTVCRLHSLSLFLSLGNRKRGWPGQQSGTKDTDTRKAFLGEGVYGLEWTDYTGYEDLERPNRRWQGHLGASNSRKPPQDKWGKECYAAQGLDPWWQMDPWWAKLPGAGYMKETSPSLTPSLPTPSLHNPRFFFPPIP